MTLPATFRAVTTHATFLPRIAGVSLSRDVVNLGDTFVPIRHRYVSLGSGAPRQAPDVHVSVLPTRAVPRSFGSDRDAGFTAGVVNVSHGEVVVPAVDCATRRAR